MKAALITGGQQGIGLAVAEALAADGFRIAIASLPAAADPAVKAALTRLGTRASYHRHDMADIAGIPALLHAVEAEHGPITTFVSNAGVPAKVRGDMLDVAPEAWDQVMAVNLRGAFFLAQAVAKRLLAQDTSDHRSMIFVTSVSAAMASVERAEYCVSKSAAAMAAQLFALRLAPHGVGVYELRPGIIETGMTAGVRDSYTARIEGGLVPAGRWGQPQDIARVAVPLARGDFAFATGAVISVDGGLSIQRL
jgi:NAD(P)-dependent dehydrogenase (short-subunit alcohol dehydrogenase family)